MAHGRRGEAPSGESHRRAAEGDGGRVFGRGHAA